MRGTIPRSPNLGSLRACETRKGNSQPTPTMATRVALDLINSSERRSDKGRLSLGENENQPGYVHRKVSLTLAHDAVSGCKYHFPNEPCLNHRSPTMGSRRKPIREQNDRKRAQRNCTVTSSQQKNFKKNRIVPKRANLVDFKLKVCQYATDRRQQETPSILAYQLAQNPRFPAKQQQAQSGKPTSTSRSS